MTKMAASAFAASMFITSVQAVQQGVTWNPGTANPDLWSNPASWGGSVPVAGYKAFFNVSTVGAAVVDSAQGGCQISIGDGGNGTIIVTNGGNLDCGDTSAIVDGSVNKDAYAWTGLGTGGGTGTMYIAQSANVTFEYHLWMGLNDTGHGFLIMNGGTASVLGAFRIGSPNAGLGQSHVQMNGGVLTLSQWNDGGGITTGSSMDIAGGTVIINGDHTTSINTYHTAGQITAFGGAGTLVVDYNNTNPGKTTITATGGGGGGGGCATLSGFNGTGLDGYFSAWATGTIVSNANNLQITATGFGDGYKALVPSVSTTSNLTLSLDVTLTASDVMGPLVVLEDGNANQVRYAFYNTTAGNHVLTAVLSSGTLVQGAGPFDFSNIKFFHVQLDPEGVSGAYTVQFNDLSVTGCGGGGTSGTSHIDSTTVSGGNVNLSVTTQTGASYHVEATTGFPASWSTVAGTTTNATGTATSFSFTKPGSSTQFYRIGSP